MKAQEIINKLSIFDPNTEVIIEIDGIVDNYGYMLKAKATVDQISGDSDNILIISGTDLNS